MVSEWALKTQINEAVNALPKNYLSRRGMVSMRLVEEELVTSPHPPVAAIELHKEILRHRPEVEAIIQAHSPYALSLSCRGEPIPPFHFRVARFGGSDIRCAHVWISDEPWEKQIKNVVSALDERLGCLIENYGMLVVGTDISAAIMLALEIELLCEQYWQALKSGSPKLLSPQELKQALTVLSIANKLG